MKHNISIHLKIINLNIIIIISSYEYWATAGNLSGGAES
jgi:hypothetical protein